VAKKILLIEDEPRQIEIYEKVIGEAGFEIESLKWGKEGLERLEEIKTKKKETPDLILLDLILPDINGIAILEKAKAEPQLKDIPFFERDCIKNKIDISNSILKIKFLCLIHQK